jgi:hypothetical protein
MVKIKKRDIKIIWFFGITPLITEEDFKKLREQGPGTWGQAKKLNEFKILNIMNTLSKLDISCLIQDVLNIKAGRPIPSYQFAGGLSMKNLLEVAELLGVEIPKKISGQGLTNLIVEKIRAEQKQKEG